MLGLRLKYDCKALFRMVWPLYIVGIVLPIGIRLSHWLQVLPLFASFVFEMISLMYGGIYFFSLAALVIWPIVVTVRDFFNTMLKDEGYLTNTLPVSRNILFLSKELAGLTIFCLSGLVLMLSLWILSSDFSFEVMFAGLPIQDGRTIGFIILMVLMILASFYQSITMFFLSMMLGQLHRLHKGLFSVVYYFVISFGLQILALILLMIFAYFVDNFHLEQGFTLFVTSYEWVVGMMLVGALTIYNFVLGGIFHSVGVWISNHKLNLE